MTGFDFTRRIFMSKGASSALMFGLIALIGGSMRKTSVSTSGPAAAKGPTGLVAATSEMKKWKNAVGRKFKLSSPNGAITAMLTSVEGQPSMGVRPRELRQQPMRLNFALIKGHDTAGDEIYALDQGAGVEAQFFMQRGADRSGVRLVALLN